MTDPIKPQHYAREADRQAKLNIREHMNSNQALGALAIRIANEHVYNEESDRQYFDRKHDHTGAGEREEVYQMLADIEHNDEPIRAFKDDYVGDDERLLRLIVDCLKDEFSNFHDTDETIGRRLKNIVKLAFPQFVSMRSGE